MENLRNLKHICNLTISRFNEYDGKEFVLPQIFKERVKEINSSKITYNEYSAVIETRDNLKIFLPNQWFYIASYFTDLYNELQKYKKEALKVISKERLKELNSSTLTQLEMSHLQELSLDDESKSYLVQFMTDYSWWSGGKTIDRGDFFVSPILNSAKLVNASQSFIADLCAFLSDKKDLVQAIKDVEEGEFVQTNKAIQRRKDLSLQQIFYGAPGTGKSNTIKCEVDQNGLPRVRTTFHPDSDYSTFVGAYKPTSVEVPVMTIIGKEQVPVMNAKPERKIVYEFVPQAFLKAYTEAWKNQNEPFFLIIEEINRGNCAQIFGDLFQLLDRNNEGESDYPVSPDEDIQKFLLTDKKYGFAELTDEQKAAIPEEVQTGELLKLPKNLHIWATMNTSDQSLFPIDSAFKRRWDWQYIPISDGKKGWEIEVNGKRYDWWQFLQKMNDKIGSTTNSEDKKLGYYFCKTTNGTINAETFVGKVIFYIWNDIFKDFAGEAGTLFKDVDDSLLLFNKFYIVDADGKTKVAEDKVELFLQNLGVEPIKDGSTEKSSNS